MNIVFGALCLIVAILMCLATYGMLCMFDFSIKKLWGSGWPFRVDLALFITVSLSCMHGFIKLL